MIGEKRTVSVLQTPPPVVNIGELDNFQSKGVAVHDGPFKSRLL
jgi:hypothetical protein